MVARPSRRSPPARGLRAGPASRSEAARPGPRRGHVGAHVHHPAVPDPDDVDREPHVLHPEGGRVVRAAGTACRRCGPGSSARSARADAMLRHPRRRRGRWRRRPAPPSWLGAGVSPSSPHAASTRAAATRARSGLMRLFHHGGGNTGPRDRPPLPHPSGPRRRSRDLDDSVGMAAPGGRRRHRGDRATPHIRPDHAVVIGELEERVAQRECRAGRRQGRRRGCDGGRGVRADARPARRRRRAARVARRAGVDPVEPRPGPLSDHLELAVARSPGAASAASSRIPSATRPATSANGWRRWSRQGR